MIQYDPTPSAALVAEWGRIIRSQIGDGYTDDPDATIAKEIAAAAYVFAWADNVLTQAGAEMHVGTAVETIDEHEHALTLPNDSGVSPEERLARVRAFTASRGLNAASLGRVIEALGSLGPIELKSTGSGLFDVAAFDAWHALTTYAKIGSADFEASRVRQALALILERSINVARFGTDHVSGARILATAEGALWDSVTASDGNTQKLGRVTLGRILSATVSPWVSRVRDFGTGGVLHLDDMRKLARALVTQPGQGATAYDPTGDLVCIASVAVPGATTVQVETAHNWNDRAIVVTGQAHTSDIRPGGAAEDGDGNRFGPFFWAPGWGGTSFVTFHTNLVIRPTALGNGLEIENTGGSAHYVNLYARASGKIAGGSGPKDPLGLAADSVSVLSPSAWHTLAAAHSLRGGAADAWAAGENEGVIHRLAMTPRFTIPASGVTEIVLDSSIDWRDRFVVLTYGSWDHRGYAVFPGMHDGDNPATECDQSDTDTALPSTFVFGYTGAGHAAGVGAAGQWDIAIGDIVAVRVFANSTTGALTLAIPSTAGPAGFPATAVIEVIGSFRIGAHSSPAAPNASIALPVTGDTIDASQLNLAQDYHLEDYANAGRTASSDVGGLGLGLDVTGTPAIARIARARRDKITGYAQDASSPIVRRERGDGAIRVVDKFTVATSTLIDDSHDWRDRWVSCFMLNSSAASYVGSFYSGPGTTFAVVDAAPGTGWARKVVAGVWIYADSETGALYAVNPGGVGSTPVQILIYGSLPLGGRSVKREAVRRSYRPALGLTGIYLWLTAGRCALTTALGRRVGVGESLSGVLHSATGINGFQSSGAAAVGFYGQAAMTGTTFPWVPGAAGRVYPALRVYAAGAQPWKTNLTAGTYEFLHKGPCTFIYVLTCLVDRPWDAGTTATSTRWPLVKNHYGTVGFELAIDSETGVPIWVRMDTAESVFMARTPVKDGRTHWITVRQTATAGDLEIYVDGVLDTTGICTTITNNAAGQLMLASVAPGCSYGVASTGYTMAAHDLHEMIAISGSLPDAQLAQIHAELARTYGSEA